MPPPRCTRVTWTALLVALALLVGAALVLFVGRRDAALKAETFAAQQQAPLTSPDQGLFLFANNRCDPACCPGQFSCRGGCVCVTEAQTRLLSRAPPLPPPPAAAAPGAPAKPPVAAAKAVLPPVLLPSARIDPGLAVVTPSLHRSTTLSS
jgi:hypothetical protein